jgi:hypothetical protein
MALAINSLPVPDSPVTRIVELESFIFSTLRATSDIARLLKTIPGSELTVETAGFGLAGTGTPKD